MASLGTRPLCPLFALVVAFSLAAVRPAFGQGWEIEDEPVSLESSPLEAALEDLSGSLDAEDRAEAARALGEMQERAALKGLLAALTADPSPMVRRAIVGALGRYLSDVDARVALRHTQRSDPDESVRVTAARLLAAFEARRGGQEDPEAAWRLEAIERFGFVDPDVGHGFLTPTAFGPREGDFYAKGYGFGHWQLRYGATDNLAVGGQFSLPVFVFNVGLDARYTHSLSPYVHLGGFFDVNFIHGFSGLEHLALVTYGGGPILSLGPSWANVTLSLPVYGLYSDFSRGEGEDLWAFVPGVSVGARVHRYVRLLLEFHFPIGGDGDGVWLGGDDGVVFLMSYGLRLHGERFFGDVGFLMPFTGNEFFILDVFPMGLPMLSFGFNL